MYLRQKNPPDSHLTPIEQIFQNRDISPKDISHYFNTTNEDLIDSSCIKNISQGAKLLLSHIANEHNIFIQIDSDCDGYTSAASLINYLYKIVPSYVDAHVSYRVHTGKQHGIILDTIPEDVQLVIVPDAGSNNFIEHEQLAQRGCDVLVIDHHETSVQPTPACIINNQICNYPTKALSGAGMVFKFCSYLDTLCGTSYANDLMDLVALGIIADVMDVRPFEVKHIITQGLANIKNPFMREMTQMQSFSIERAGGLCPYAVSFYIAPLVNAVIRVGEEEDKILLFESMLFHKGNQMIPSTKRGCKGSFETKAQQVCRLCTKMKRLQTKMVEENLTIIESIIEENNLLANQVLVVTLPATINKNLTGLIANQLMAKYQHPTLLLLETEYDNQKTLMGSARGFETQTFANFKDFIKDSQYSVLAEGHQYAFGVGIASEKLSDFIQYSNDYLQNELFEVGYDVDFIWDKYDSCKNSVIEIASCEPIWGQGLPEPLIAFLEIPISPEKITLMSRDKNPTLKIEYQGISFIKFKSSEAEYQLLTANKDLGQDICLTIVGVCALNEWNGKVTPQVKVKDYQINGWSYNF